MTHLLNKIKFKANKTRVMSKFYELKTVHLEITWDCNLNCVMCPRRKGYGQKTEVKNKNISLEQVKKIDSLLPESVKTINIIGAGEPMIHKNFYEILNVFKTKTIVFTTNGTFLNQDNIKRLPDNVKQIYISVDSPFEKTYSKIRVGSSLKKVVSNIFNLRYFKPEREVSIQMLVDKHNVLHIARMIDLCKEAGIGLKLIHPICFNKKMNEDHLINSKNIKIILKTINEKAKKKKIPYHPRSYIPVEKFCKAPFHSMLISINGDVFPCCYIYEGRGDNVKSFSEWFNNKKISVPMDNYVMGNIFKENNIQNIWENDKFNRLRSYLINSRYKENLVNIRNKICFKDFNYCDICLYRWGMAC